MEEVSVLFEPDGEVLEKFEGQTVHLVVLLLEVLDDPLIFLLGWEGSVLVQWQWQRLITAQFQRTAEIEHLLVSRIVANKWSKSAIVVVMTGCEIVPDEFFLLSLRDLLKEGLHSPEQLTLIEPSHVGQREKANCV